MLMILFEERQRRVLWLREEISFNSVFKTLTHLGHYL